MDVFRAAAFPLPQLLTIAQNPAVSVRPSLHVPAVAPLFDHVIVAGATLPKLIVALVSWALLVWCGFAGRPMSVAFAAHIILRDLVITWVLGGGWDLILSLTHTTNRPAVVSAKINPQRISRDHLLSCMFWSTVSTLVASGLEILCWSAFGTSTHKSILSWSSCVWTLTMPYWRIAHFYAVHRVMHPWRTTRIPDLGKVLYNHVHSLHHRSYNPSTWSGISMHPLESALYYSTAFIPPLLGAHPLIFLLTKHDCTLGAMWGHDGFSDPGVASFGHYLHHAYLSCNYGENYFPLDHFFGSHQCAVLSAPAHTDTLSISTYTEVLSNTESASMRKEA